MYFFSFFLIRNAGNSDTWANVLLSAWLGLHRSVFLRHDFANLPGHVNSFDHCSLLYCIDLTPGGVRLHTATFFTTGWRLLFMNIHIFYWLLGVYFCSCCLEWRRMRGTVPMKCSLELKNFFQALSGRDEMRVE